MWYLEGIKVSLRPIEAQGSFPNSQKSGKLQEQLQQRGQVGQEIIGQQQLEEERKKRKRVNETTASDQARLNKEGNSNNEPKKEQPSKEKGERELEPETRHPYKGQFIDFSG